MAGEVAVLQILPINRFTHRWGCGCTAVPLPDRVSGQHGAQHPLKQRAGDHLVSSHTLHFSALTWNRSFSLIQFMQHDIKGLFNPSPNSLLFHLEERRRDSMPDINYTLEFNALPRLVT